MFWFWRYAITKKLRKRTFNSRKVLLLRLDLIGDCTMFTDAAYAIREAYMDREIAVVCLSSTRPIFERLGIFDRIIEVGFRPEAVQWNMVGELISRLQDDEYDILLQPQLSKFPIADIIVAAVKCNQRISIEPLSPNGNSSPAWIKMTNFLFDQLIAYPRGNVSEFDYYKSFVQGACDPLYKTKMPHLPYEKQNIVQGEYYVLYPGGSMTQKYWSLDRYAAVAEYIHRETGLVGVILASEKEKFVSQDLKAHLNKSVLPFIMDLTGKTTVSQVIDIIGNAEFVVTNDTSGVHIAAATGTPSVAIAGGWHFKRFLPYSIEDIQQGDRLPLVAYTQLPCYNCDWNLDVISKTNPECFQQVRVGMQATCIPAVTVQQVIELVDYIIDEEGLKQ